MPLLQKLRNHFINAFRELFLYHYSSLEFRAKLFAAVIAANPEAGECEFEIVRNAGMLIYEDSDRSASLALAVREFVEKVIDDNGLDLDSLLEEIVRDLRDIPRYGKKIDTSMLYALLECHQDEDTKLYQQRMIELFERLRDECAA